MKHNNLYGNTILNTVHEHDCLDFMRSLPAACVDVVVSDPPYRFEKDSYTGRGNKYRKAMTAKLQHVGAVMGLDYNPRAYLEACEHICKPFNGYFFCNKALVPEYLNFAIERKYNYDILLWHKPSPMPSHNRHYLIDKEYCIFIRSAGAYFNSHLSYRHYKTVKEFSFKKRSTHPTEKPVQFMKECILVSCPENGIVFDGYTGSGTTGIAALESARHFVGCELDPEFCRVANDALQQTLLFTGHYVPQKPVRFQKVVA
jgi:site-specific DNA-methyltransferase (adenine-specific)